MRRSAAVAVVFALMLQPQPARAARVLEHYDLDSLVDQSKAIVRVEVGDAQPFKTADGDCVVHTATVLDAIEGPAAKATQIRIAGLDEYHQAPGSRAAATRGARSPRATSSTCSSSRTTGTSATRCTA